MTFNPVLSCLLPLHFTLWSLLSFSYSSLESELRWWTQEVAGMSRQNILSCACLWEYSYRGQENIIKITHAHTSHKIKAVPNFSSHFQGMMHVHTQGYVGKSSRALDFIKAVYAQRFLSWDWMLGLMFWRHNIIRVARLELRINNSCRVCYKPNKKCLPKHSLLKTGCDEIPFLMDPFMLWTLFLKKAEHGANSTKFIWFQENVWNDFTENI